MGKAKRHGKTLTKAKARKILSHDRVRGKKLTARQRRFMGAKAKP